MASFTADLGDTTKVPDDIWYSRGVPPSKSMETLFSGVGQALQGAVSTGVNVLDKSIQQKFDQFRDNQLGNITQMAGIPNDYGTKTNGSAYPSAAEAGVGQPVQTTATNVPAGLAARGSGMGRAGGAPIFSPETTPGTSPTNPVSLGTGGGAAAPGEAPPPVPAATTVSNNGQTGGPDPTVAASIAANPVLADAQERFRKLGMQYAQGTFSPALFWLSVDSYSKELRSMFPGSNAEINQMANDVFGYHTVAGHIMSAEEEMMKQRAAGTTAEQQRATTMTEKYSGPYLEAGGDPNVLAEAMSNPNMALARQIAVTAMPTMAKNLELEHKKTQLQVDADQGKVDQSKILQTYTLDTGIQVRNILKQSTVAMGGTKQNLQTFFDSTLSDIGQNKPISDDTWKALDTGVQQAQATVAKKFAEMQSDPNYSKLSPTEREAQNKAASVQLDALEKAVSGKDAKMVALFANSLHIQQDQAVGSALNDKTLMTGYIADQVNKGAGAEWGQKNADKVVQHAATIAATLAGSGVKTNDDVIKNIYSDPDMSTAQKSKAAEITVNSQIQNIGNGKVDPDTLKKWVASNMGQGNSGFGSYWSLLKDEDSRTALYNQLSSPKMSKAIADLHDNNSSATYQQWMADQGLSLKGVRSALAQISGSMQADPKTSFSYGYNPATNQFQVVAPSGQTPSALGLGNGTYAVGATKTLQSELVPLNQFLSNYSAMLKAQGKDPSDPAIGTKALLQGLGAQPPGSDTRKPETFWKAHPPTQGAGPLGYASEEAPKAATPATSAIDDAMHANNPDGTAKQAKMFLDTVSAHPERGGDTSNLHPEFATRLAAAIQQAHAEGLPVTMQSGFRSNSTTGSFYDSAGYSMHGYGAAADVGGIGDAGSPTALKWAKIAEANGLHNPYGIGNPREFNHWQLTDDKLEEHQELFGQLKAAKTQQEKWDLMDTLMHAKGKPTPSS